MRHIIRVSPATGPARLFARWKVVVDSVVVGVFFTQARAVRFGRYQARILEPSQLVVHRRNGRIAYEHTYPRASDPIDRPD